MKRWGTLCFATLLTIRVTTAAGAGLPPQLCVASGDSVQLTVTDVFSIMQSVVRSGDCPLDRCDRNCDGRVTVVDALAALHELLCVIPEGCSRCCGE